MTDIPLTRTQPASVQDPHPTTDLDFSGILRSSLERDIMYKSTCQVCKNLANHRSRRALSSTHMPPLLAVNAAVNNEDHFRFWLDNHSSRFLSSSVPLAMRDAEGVLDPNSAEVVTYDLRVSSSDFVPYYYLVFVCRATWLKSGQAQFVTL